MAQCYLCYSDPFSKEPMETFLDVSLHVLACLHNPYKGINFSRLGFTPTPLVLEIYYLIYRKLDALIYIDRKSVV